MRNRDVLDLAGITPRVKQYAHATSYTVTRAQLRRALKQPARPGLRVFLRKRLYSMLVAKRRRTS